jgi:hypothetical protein
VVDIAISATWTKSPVVQEQHARSGEFLQAGRHTSLTNRTLREGRRCRRFVEDSQQEATDARVMRPNP